MLNLVINARDAMPNGGDVWISTAPWIFQSDVTDPAPGNYVRARVKDNGLGMSNEVLNSIFKPFFTTKGEKGPASAFLRWLPLCAMSADGCALRANKGRAQRSIYFFQRQSLLSRLPQTKRAS